MIITRDKSKLTTQVQTGIGYYLNFDHECGSDANAEAWKRHVESHYAKQAEYATNRERNHTDRVAELERLVKNLQRSVRRAKLKYKRLTQ